MKLPRHVHGFRDRHGTARYYFRRPGFKRAALPGLPWCTEFMAAYEAANSGAWPKNEIGAARTIPGTVNAAVISYVQCAQFKSLADGTQKMRRAILERFREQHGDKRVAMLERDHLEKIFGALRPWAARNWLKTIRGLLVHCVAIKMIRHDPSQGIRLAKAKSTGFKPWTDNDVALFEAKHPAGSKARLALALYLQTGAARADVVRLGRQHIKGDLISITRRKTGTPCEIVVLTELTAALESTPKIGDLIFLVTEFGKPFTAAGFGNWFADRCKEAGVSSRGHGLRKLAATRMAEAGATEHQLMAWFGWKSIREAQRYTEAANRKRLARSAGLLMVGTGTSVGKPDAQVAKNAANPLKAQG